MGRQRILSRTRPICLVITPVKPTVMGPVESGKDRQAVLAFQRKMQIQKARSNIAVLTRRVPAGAVCQRPSSAVGQCLGRQGAVHRIFTWCGHTSGQAKKTKEVENTADHDS